MRVNRNGRTYFGLRLPDVPGNFIIFSMPFWTLSHTETHGRMTEVLDGVDMGHGFR